MLYGESGIVGIKTTEVKHYISSCVHELQDFSKEIDTLLDHHVRAEIEDTKTLALLTRLKKSLDKKIMIIEEI